MATADPAVLDDFLNKYKTQVDAGFGLIQGDVSGVLGTLVVISIAVTAVLWAIDENHNVMASLVRKVLLVGFFAWLVTQWHSLSTTVVNGFAALGLKAGGGGMDVSTFTTSPSKIVMAGINVISGLLQYVLKIAPGPIEFFNHIDVVLMAIVAAIGILIAFVILAVEIVVTIIEFHIVTLVAFVTVPFGVLSQTSFMSERAIGYVVSVGIKLMALAIVVSLGTTIFNTYTVSSEPGIGEDVGLLLAAVLMVMLSLKIPAIAGALISGGPQLSAGGAVMGAAGVAAGVAGGALAARALGGAIAGGWAAGGGEVAAARNASGAIPAGGGTSPSGGGAGGGGGPGAGDFARAPVSSTAQTLRMAGRRLMGSGTDDASDDETPPPPPPAPAETVARTEQRGAFGDIARGAAATAMGPQDASAPGMTASRARSDDDLEPPPGA
ncbi:MAG TPA: P-type conjugative transfer protein TrbL [Caulobacteraceae bacterium]|nr:P-type conjugative transfer protein TrbL [Caulobacteraceae bacterium]